MVARLDNMSNVVGLDGKVDVGKAQCRRYFAAASWCYCYATVMLWLAPSRPQGIMNMDSLGVGGRQRVVAADRRERVRMRLAEGSYSPRLGF